VNGELRRTLKDVPECFEDVRKIIKTYRYNRLPGKESNHGPFEYKLRVLTTQILCSVGFLVG
jgi:hypothetical protein